MVPEPPPANIVVLTPPPTKAARWARYLTAVAIVAFLVISAWSQQTNRQALHASQATLGALRAALCAGGFSADKEPCPPPSAAQRAQVARIAQLQASRDDANTAKVLKGLQELLDRPATVRVVEGPGRTRTIYVTRTICKTPSGKPC